MAPKKSVAKARGVVPIIREVVWLKVARSSQGYKQVSDRSIIGKWVQAVRGVPTTAHVHPQPWVPRNPHRLASTPKKSSSSTASDTGARPQEGVGAEGASCDSTAAP